MSHLTRRSFLVSLACISALGLATGAPNAAAFGLGGGTTTDVKSQTAIRELYAQFEQEWNKHDVAKMAAHWAIDGDHVEPDGTVAKGRDEVTALLTKQHAGVFKNTTLKLTIRTPWIMSDTVALVDGTYELSGATLPDGTPIPARTGMLTSVLLLDKGKWQIEASRLMIPTQLPYKEKGAAAAAGQKAPAAGEAPKKP